MPSVYHVQGRRGVRAYDEAELAYLFDSGVIDGATCEWGKVLVWEPPARVVLAWQTDGTWKHGSTDGEIFAVLRDGGDAVG